MTGYLIDADWTIDALARAPRVRALDSLLEVGVAISCITIGELYEGAYRRSPHPQERIATYRAFLARFEKLPVDEPIAERFAELRAALRRRGELISDFDIILAAIALEYDLEVLTFNVPHFRRIPNLRIYQPSP